MFVEAIENAATFTRAIHSISRNYGSKVVQPGAATLFFVNSDGWALTCRHVAGQLQAAGQILEKYQDFKNELASRRGEKREKLLRQELEKKYKYAKNVTAELHNRFINCSTGPGNVSCEVRMHSTLDVALIRFESFDQSVCNNFPVFPKDTTGLKQGLSLCRLGFPFPEFTNFDYDEATETTSWTTTGQSSSPRFPIEGMVTRLVRDSSGETTRFEMSTPGLRGQSGGPAFDAEGRVWGMQSETAHLDLNFDVDQEVLRSGTPKRVQDSPFLHVGRCIHVDVLKTFMRDQGVHFDEA